MRQAQQGLILRGAIDLRCQHYNAPFTFRLAADIAHEAIDGDGIAPFVEPVEAHKENPRPFAAPPGRSCRFW